MKSETKYIFSKGDLTRQDFSIKYKNETGNFYLPIEKIKEIYCFNELTLSTKLLDILSTAGIIVHFFNYYENYIGTFYPRRSLISGRLTIKQAIAFENNRLDIAKAIVRGIAQNIKSVVYHYYRHGVKELKESIDFYNKDVEKLLEKSKDIKQILSVGVKRPPDNPMNALISFGNTLLYTKTISQIYNTHLEQSISFLHEPSEGRFSLCLDLSEVFKPVIVFKTIFDLVNNRKINVEKHFEEKLNYSLLNENGKKIFIEAFEDRINQTFEHPKLNRKITYKQAIKLDGYKLIKYIMEGKEFIPFDIEKKE